MSRRWYGISRGETQVTEGSSTGSKDVEVDINRAVSLGKGDICVMIEEIVDKICAGNFPPAAATMAYRGWGIQRGGRAQDIVEANPVPASATITCASVAESDTVTVNGRLLTAQDGREKFTVLCVADSAGSLNSKYFTFSKGSVDYYVWMNVNSAGVDPALSGKTGVPVAVATNASNTTVATAVSTAIDALAGVTAGVSSATVTVTIDAVGVVTDAAQGAASTGFTITITRQGADTPASNKFFMNVDNTTTAVSLVAAIAASDQAANITATSSLGVVTLTAVEDGTAGNALTLVSSNGTRLAVTGSGNLAGGTAAAAGKDLRVEVRMAVSTITKNDVQIALTKIRDYILNSSWPLS